MSEWRAWAGEDQDDHDVFEKTYVANMGPNRTCTFTGSTIDVRPVRIPMHPDDSWAFGRVTTLCGDCRRVIESRDVVAIANLLSLLDEHEKLDAAAVLLKRYGGPITV